MRGSFPKTLNVSQKILFWQNRISPFFSAPLLSSIGSFSPLSHPVPDILVKSIRTKSFKRSVVPGRAHKMFDRGLKTFNEILVTKLRIFRRLLETHGLLIIWELSFFFQMLIPASKAPVLGEAIQIKRYSISSLTRDLIPYSTDHWRIPPMVRGNDLYNRSRNASVFRNVSA